MSFRYGLVVLLVLGLAAPALAQESAAVLSAKQHLRALASDALTGDDLSDLRALDAYPDRRSGATMVYLAQRHLGIEVYGAIAPVAVMPDGKTHGLSPRRFVSGLASRVNSTEPRLASGSARSAAEAHVRALVAASPAPEVATVTDGPEIADAPVAYDATEPRLVYQPTENGTLRLAWATTLTGRSGVSQMWGVRVDALTGEILAAEDLVDRDHWPSEAPSGTETVSLAPLATETLATPMKAGSESYRVLGWPIESPVHGAFSVVTDPADATASPFGWHNTGVQGFTTTRGNNVFAYVDRDDDNLPDSEGNPDGGAGLSFDFAYDQTRHPRESREAAVTNLFYWGNVFHDITYQYGFDEASGNFQVNNNGNGGLGNDAANLEAQSGAQRCATTTGNFACYNNANFSTPADGGSGRMQMFEWYDVTSVDITSPTPATFDAFIGLFGVPGAISGEVVGVLGGPNAEIHGRACLTTDVTNPGAISGKIALIERGDCSFTTKVRVAEALGAIGAIIHNNARKGTGETGSPEDLVNMAIAPTEADDIGITSIFVQQSTGITMGGAAGTTAQFTVLPRRDSDFDASIIAHEFGHGVSNRLTGGPGQSGCLGNGEQMGEGWSDYYGLLLTMTAANDTPRGLAPYVNFEGTDGEGIRPAPYTRDFAVNDYTYQNVITESGTTLSVPHGLGFVWASMLWDMTLDLTDAFGFDADVYDADGGAGNQIAMNLVTQGMKLQPCQPGFVDGRDGILEADTLLYGGAYSDIIWAAFARRGLGLLADQGTSTSPTDGTADFTVPVARESGPNTQGARLAVLGANPVRGTTAVALTLAAPEDVTLRVVDLLGREVMTLHQGAVAADTRREFALDASALAPGVYVVRATGDTFTASRRITVVR